MAIVFKVKPWYKKSGGLSIVPFSTGTDAQIAAMLDAYYNNEITWQEMGWAVGDTRLIHFDAMQEANPNSGSTRAAQDMTIVIVAHDHTPLASAINGHSNACITVQTREIMSGGFIFINGNSSRDSYFTKWSNLYMRTYMNNTVLGAIPSGDFKSAIKQSKHYRHTTYNGTASEEVTDTLFLPSYPEIFGTESYSYYVATNPVEGTQFDYYATASNRIKYVNNNGVPSASAQYWWQGSASSFYDTSDRYCWCRVRSDGGSSFGDGTSNGGLAPAWAM